MQDEAPFGRRVCCDAVESPEPSVQRQRGPDGPCADPSRRHIRRLEPAFDTKRAATACARSALEDRAGGDDENLAAFLEQVWLPAKQGRVEGGTYEQYRWAVGRHIVPLIGAVRLRDLKPEVVDEWCANSYEFPRLGNEGWVRLRRGLSERCCRWRCRRQCNEGVSLVTQWF